MFLEQSWKYFQLKKLKMTTWKSFSCSPIALPHRYLTGKTVENFYKCLTTNLTWESWKKNWKIQLFHVKFVVKHFQKFSTVVLFSWQLCREVIGESLNFIILSFSTASVFHMFSNCFTTYLTGKKVENFYKCFTTNLTLKSWKKSWTFSSQICGQAFVEIFNFFSCQICGKAIGEHLKNWSSWKW